MPLKNRSQALAAGIILGLAGFACNWLKLELFPGVELLFGSVFVMAAIIRYGALAGAVAGVIAACNGSLPGSPPWTMLVLSCEALFVGWRCRKSPHGVLIQDALFWLCGGTTLTLVCRHLVTGLEPQTALLIMVTRSLNGIGNALLATVLLLALQAWRRQPGDLPSYRQILFTSLVCLAFLPTVVLAVLDARQMVARDEARMVRVVNRAAELAVKTVSQWLNEHQQSVQTLARLVGNPDDGPTARIQSQVETIKAASPAFRRMGVQNARSISIAWSPLTDDRGKSTLGIDYSDRPYVAEMKRSLRPYVADLVVGRVGKPAPILPLVAPLVVSGAYRGYCSGIVDFGAVKNLLDTIAGPFGASITLLDRRGQVIVSTRKDLATMQRFARPSGGSVRQFAGGVYHWFPKSQPGIGPLQRLGSSRFVKEQAFAPEIGWTAVAEVSLAQMLDLLAGATARSFLLLCFLLLAILCASRLISKGLVGTLVGLQQATRFSPQSLLEEPQRQPLASRIDEFDRLIGHFGEMSAALRRYFRELNRLNETQEQRIEERTNQLQESEQRFQMLANTAPVLIWLSDTSRQCTWFNKGWLDFTGRSLQQETGTGWTEAVHPEDLPACLATWNGSFETRHSFQMEYRLKRADGEYRWIADHGVPRWDAAGEFCGYIGSCTDITERKLIEGRMTESEEQFRAVVECSPYMTVIHCDGRFLYLNPAALARFGAQSRQELVGTAVIDRIHPDIRATVVERISRTQKYGEPAAVMEERLVTLDGSGFVAEISSIPYAFEGRNAVLSYGIDVTGKKLAEQALRDSERFLELTIDTVPECVKLLAEDGSLLMMNRAGLDMIDADSFETVRGFFAHDLVCERYRADFQLLTRNAFRGEQGKLVFELVGLKGRHLRLESHAVPLRNDRGEIVSMLAITRDLGYGGASGESTAG